MLSTLGKVFSGRHSKIFFIIFPRKQDWTFHEKCLQSAALAQRVIKVNAKKEADASKTFIGSYLI